MSTGALDPGPIGPGNEIQQVDPDFYQYIFEHHPLPAWIYDSETLAFLAVNRAAIREYGYTQEEFLAMRITDVRNAEDARLLLDFLSKPVASQVTTGPWRHRRKDGSALKVTVYAHDLILRGRKARMVLVNDISERERLERELRLFAAAVAGASEAVMITEGSLLPPGPGIVFVNAAFTSMTGYSSDEVIGRSPGFLQGPKSDRIPLDQIDRDLKSTGSVVYQSVNYRKDGSEYLVEWQVAPLRDESGAITHYLSLQRDITERTRLQEQFQQAQKMEAVGRLAGGIAHDFNNLLTIILGYTGLLSLEVAKTSKDPKQIRNLEEIQKAAENAATLTSQLLAFSRKQVLRTRVVELNPVIANLEGMLRRLIGEDVELELVLDPAVGRVKADPSQLEQALMNLAVNARDAMPYGGMLTIESRNVEISRRYAALSSLKPGPHVLVSVSDTGTGMDEDTRVRVFEPFFTTKETGRGTGLGLSMVYGFVKQSGGSVHVYSEPQQGACFKIYLPRTIAAADAEAERAMVTKRQGSGLILVVEDEIGIRELIREILAAAGYEVYTAANAREGLEFTSLYEGEIHLLLTDVVLPGMSGPEMAEQMKRGRPELKVLFASGYSDHALLRRGALARGAAFVSKPFDTDTLLSRVSDLVTSASKSGTSSL